jgi:hypothetical protein
VKRNPTEAALVLVLGGWFASVLFPSQSAWIEWAFCAVVMLFVLWRLVLVCGRAMGKLPAISVNWFLEVFSTALSIAMCAWFVWCIYHGGLRNSLACPVLGTLFWWTLLLRWFQDRSRAGPLIVALRPPLRSPLGIMRLCMLVGGGLLIVASIGMVLEQKGDLREILSAVHYLSFSTYLFLCLAVGIEVRKQGCIVSLFRFIPWEQIASYRWSTSKQGALRLRLELYNSLAVIEHRVDPARKEMVDQILKERLLHRPPAPSPKPPSPPSKRPEWVVRIAEQQQTKAPRRAFYDCLRKHRVPHPVASPSARLFHSGDQVNIPLKDRQRARSIAEDLRHLGLAAEVIEPVTGTE